ncbi:DUF554 domain-containing protein [Clostridium sp. C8-1-8]|uniref:DUF554 domain-containing protein n=1 Tax=Clostridium sp. C8-1-8 TaxID=2698831 RepID=UPI00136E3FE1|nr:DUF554 domain-containing protein [Clostridium sp. C8-1-8]
MPIGIIVNCLSVLIGGLLGAVLGHKIPERLKVGLPLTFGVASMAMGVNYIVKMNTLPAVILSLVIGSAIGELIKVEAGIEWCAGKVKGPIESLFKGNKKDEAYKEVAVTLESNEKNEIEFMEKFVAIVILFCASGTGIFGSLKEGMTGDHTVLLAKSILDFFTAGIFATALGYLVMTVCIPQFAIMIVLYLSASFIMPLTTPSMINDFTACGGILMLATGFRISGIKSFPVANMLPALVLVMPLSHLWTSFFK